MELSRLYARRFSPEDLKKKDRTWLTLCEAFFQRYVQDSNTVLDLACGSGEFIRHIRARRKIAVDLRSSAPAILNDSVEFHCCPATELGFLRAGEVDVCFTSNFFEHLPTKAVLDEVLVEVLRVLRPGGTFLALQPNIRYAYREYWDFYDHYLPLSHLSCAEAFESAGFEVVELIDQFLPFSTKSRLPQHPALVRLYLAVPLAWRFFGKQFFIVGRKPIAAPGVDGDK